MEQAENKQRFGFDHDKSNQAIWFAVLTHTFKNDNHYGNTFVCSKPEFGHSVSIVKVKSVLYMQMLRHKPNSGEDHQTIPGKRLLNTMAQPVVSFFDVHAVHVGVNRGYNLS